MANSGRATLMKRDDGSYYISIPKEVAEDTSFPFKEGDTVSVTIEMPTKRKRLIIEKDVLYGKSPLTTSV